MAGLVSRGLTKGLKENEKCYHQTACGIGLYCANGGGEKEEEQIEILKAFSEGFAKKLASGLDKSAMHGINPRTGSASAVLPQITLTQR